MPDYTPGEHLTDEQVQRYIDRAVSPQELLAIDDHFESCVACHARCYPEERRRSDFAALWSDLDSRMRASVEHVTYEQLSSLLSGDVDEAERARVEEHLAACPMC